LSVCQFVGLSDRSVSSSATTEGNLSLLVVSDGPTKPIRNTDEPKNLFYQSLRRMELLSVPVSRLKSALKSADV